jgi:hypothetical protein
VLGDHPDHIGSGGVLLRYQLGRCRQSGQYQQQDKMTSQQVSHSQQA